MNLCNPVKFYIALTIVTTIVYACISYKENKNNKKKYNKEVTSAIMYQVLITIIWVIVLNWVCGFKNGETIAWILVFLPLLLWILLLASVIVLFKFI